MAGFRNAPGIQPARGQKIMLHAEPMGWDTIVHVDDMRIITETGMAIKIHDSVWYDLDLDSIWVGREYLSNRTGTEAVILLCDDKHIGFRCPQENGTNTAIWRRMDFIEEWTPLPLPAPEPPVKVQDIVRVMRGPLEIIGRVCKVGPEAHRFYIDNNCYDWQVDEVTKLMPESKP